MCRVPVRLVAALSLYAVSMLMVGCTEAVEHMEATVMKKTTSPEDEAMVRTWIQWLREGNSDAIKEGLAPRLRTDDLQAKLKTMTRLVPVQQPKSIKPVGYLVVHHRDSSKTITTTLEYEFSNQWLLATLVKDEDDEATTVTQFSVNRIPESVESHNRFKLLGRHLGNYVVLLLALIALAISIYGVIACLRAPMVQRRWVWAIACLVGVGRLAVNWTTGVIGFVPIWIGFPPSSAVMVPLYTPWVVYTSLPIGALLFLIRKHRLTRIRAASQLEQAQPLSQEPVSGPVSDGAH